MTDEKRFQCTFRTVGSGMVEISTVCQFRQEGTHPEDWNRFVSIFIGSVQAAISQIDHNKQPKPTKAQPRFQNFLELNNEVLVQEADDFEQKFLRKVLSVLEQNRSNVNFSTEDFSKQVCLSRSQLHRRLKLLTGYSTNGIIRRYRLEYGRRLIKNKFGNIAQVAYECGFSNPSYFSECYRKQFGMLPSEFARS